MRSIIVFLWIVLLGFILVPIATTFAQGVPENEILSTIEEQTEVKDLKITSQEQHGNKIMYCFRIEGGDFGVAVFSHYSDNYRYEEGAMAKGDDSISVSLDTGWNVYHYYVTEAGVSSEADLDTRTDVLTGTYRTYLIIAAILLIITLFSAKHRKNRKAYKRRRRGYNGEEFSENI